MIQRVLQSQLFKSHRFNSRVLFNGFRFSHSQSELAESVDNLGGHSQTEDQDGRAKVTPTDSKKTDLAWVDKVLYSSFLSKFMPMPGNLKRLRERYEAKLDENDDLVLRTSVTPPITVKYLMELKNEEIDSTPKPQNETKEKSQTDFTGQDEPPQDSPAHFPYKFASKTEFINEDSEGEPKMASVLEQMKKRDLDIVEILDEEPSVNDIFNSAREEHIIDPGIADPTVGPSDVPCGGCGAILHCQDQSIPGYISSEIFKKAKRKDLMEQVCYRCTILETHQATLNVNVSAEEYPKIVSKIRQQYAMVLLLVDLTDFPCSIWPGILDIIGSRRPIILVGNKVDMIPQDSPDYLQRMEDYLIKCAVEIGMLEGNIIHTALISAKTGYGVETLISSIFNLIRGKGDIFIMGCTNVGKSTLFNSFLKSDLCLPQANDLVQKATISQWPGTTLNLLKFPLTSPHGWRKGLRSRRLKLEGPSIKAEEFQRLREFQQTRSPELSILTGHIGRTFAIKENEDKKNVILVNDPFLVRLGHKPPGGDNVEKKRGDWDPEQPGFQDCHWVYDTPGAVNPNQILDLLTLPELIQSLPKSLIQPRTFFIKPNMSFFVGGLARIDYVEGLKPIRYTLFSNSSLPVTMCLTSDADEIYEKGLGSKIFSVPSGNEERLTQFPPLKSKKIKFTGVNHGYSCGDIVLSSIGWVGVTAGTEQEIHLEAYTPDGKGIFIRNEALLPYAPNYKGKRIRGTFSYLPHKIYCPRGKTRDS